jgi:hypothetical protein
MSTPPGTRRDPRQRAAAAIDPASERSQESLALGVGSVAFTMVELVAGVLIFSWIILFIRNAAALDMDTRAVD